MNKVAFSLSLLLMAAASAFATTHNIATETDLRNLSACNNADTVVLEDNITLSDADFTPLCPNGFKGVFDGGNFTISNLHITGNVKTTKYIAFIAFLGEGGVLKNLSFDTPIITAYEHGNGKVDSASVAVAVGALNGGLVENVHVNGGHIDVTEGKNAGVDVGGVAGTANSGTISETDGNVIINHKGNGSAVVGGICGNVTGEVILISTSYDGELPVAGAGLDNIASATKYGAITVKEKGSTKTAVIDGVYSDEGAVEITDDIVVNGVVLNRTFNENKIATLFVPFEIDASKVVGATVYKFKTVVKSDVDNRWKFKVSTAETVKPNTPYVIVPEGTQVTFDITAPVTLNTTTEGEATAANNWEFVGAYQYKKFTIDSDNPIYLFADQAQDGAKLGEFVKIAEGAFINPMRAYLVYHKSAAMQKSARGNFGSGIALPDELDIEIENEKGVVVQTGTLNTVTGDVRMDRWFDLKGRKLNAKPTAKGTYYKNGKRVAIK